MQRFRELLEQAVRIRLMADVPLGMFLSGGLDSSAIAALMAGDDRSSAADVLGRVQAARVTANSITRARSRPRIKADAHEVVIDEHDFFGALPRLIWHEDEPIAHPSSVPLYFVSELGARARQGGADRAKAATSCWPGTRSIRKRSSNWRAARRLRRAAAATAQLDRRDASCRACPMRSGAMRRRSFLAMERTPEAMFFDNFAAIGLARQHDLLAAARCRQLTGAGLRPVATLLRRAERHAARCSIACSTPTSRPTSSSC